jgi:hypothetical protein
MNGQDELLLARARLAVAVAVRQHMLVDENVTAVDFGLPLHRGVIAEDERAIRVHVRRKLPLTALEAAGVAPVAARIHEFATDVVEGTYRTNLWWGSVGAHPGADPRLGRADPLRGGISISDSRHNVAGTLGAKVTDRATGNVMILSNWHVLVGDWAARTNQPILQPGRLDGGTGADTVAGLTRDAMSRDLDAAVATLDGDRRLVNDQLGVGRVRGLARAALGIKVAKSGRSSRVTSGQVTGLEGVTRLTYAGVQRLIRQVIAIDPAGSGEVSRAGDSGALWLEYPERNGVGLHFAGSDTPERALALDLGAVLAALDVDLDTSVDVGAREPVAVGARLTRW